jgi:hypothetical protein
MGIDFGTIKPTKAVARGNVIGGKIETIEKYPIGPSKAQGGDSVPTRIWYQKSQEPNTPPVNGALPRMRAAPNLIYGFEVAEQQELPEGHTEYGTFDPAHLVGLAKLLLDTSPHLQDMRKAL